MCKKHEVHFCVGPLGDCARVWVGDDPDKYVDCVIVGGMLGEANAIMEWYKKYGEITLEEWKEYYPSKERNYYLTAIKEKGYSKDDAEKILQYLPQTEGKIISTCVDEMINLWREETPVDPSGDAPKYKMKIAKGEEDYWQDEPRSPRAAEAFRQGWVEGVAQRVKETSEEELLSLEEAIELFNIADEDREDVLKMAEQV